MHTLILTILVALVALLISVAIIAYLVYKNNKLQNIIRTMEEEKRVTNIGYNVEQMTINMSGGTLVQHADLVQASGEVVVEKEAYPQQCSTDDHWASDRAKLFTRKGKGNSEQDFFCRITDEARRNDKAKAVEEELRCACISAPKLIKAIRTNEALGYLSTKHLSSIELYNLLHEHFNLPFKSHNFAKYRSKRE